MNPVSDTTGLSGAGSPDARMEAGTPPAPAGENDGMAWRSTTPEAAAGTSSAQPQRPGDSSMGGNAAPQPEAGVGPSSAAAAAHARVGSAFSPYQRGGWHGVAGGRGGSSSGIPRRKQALVQCSTMALVATYRRCNEHFQYSYAKNPKRVLTKPSMGTKNEGYDNENSDLILYVNDALINHQPSSGICRRYVIQEMLGQGTFGQVVACWCGDIKKSVAVKVCVCVCGIGAYARECVVHTYIYI